MSFVRTVLGDVRADDLKRCGAHEHIIIDAAYIAEKQPDFLLDDIEAASVDLGEFRDADGGWVIDTMPTGAGRRARKLAAASQQSGVHIVCPTGLHLPLYYPPDHPMLSMDQEELAEVFVKEIDEAVCDDAVQLPYRAGVIKVAGSYGKLTPQQRQAFAAAGEASRRTGCPIITHTEQGTAGEEQVSLLLESGAHPTQVVLSHTDRLPDPAYHRCLLSSGVTLEYRSSLPDIPEGRLLPHGRPDCSPHPRVSRPDRCGNGLSSSRLLARSRWQAGLGMAAHRATDVAKGARR